MSILHIINIRTFCYIPNVIFVGISLEYKTYIRWQGFLFWSHNSKKSSDLCFRNIPISKTSFPNQCLASSRSDNDNIPTLYLIIIILIWKGYEYIIKTINEFAETAEVEFEDGRWAEYSFKQLDELELAYAVTIHKSQGSEYPAVIIPLLSGPRMLMNRNLLYTAVTRARKCVTVVGSEETFRDMIRNEKQQRRYSSLDQRIQETE